MKYSPDGVELWVALYDGTVYRASARARDLVVDGSGNVLVTGYSAGGIATVKYSSEGSQLGVAHYAGLGSFASPVGLGLDGAGNVYVTGSDGRYGGHGSFGWGVYTTIKYDRLALALDDAPAALPARFSLRQNYPNPFNPVTTLRYDLPHRAKVTLSIYDILGREVARLVQGDQAAGYHQVIWDGRNEQGQPVSSGVYLYRLHTGSSAGNFIETRKMVLLR